MSKTEKLILPENITEQPITLPKSFDDLLLQWPELKPLLTAFALRDHATFMHSVAVHSTATQLANDLFLRFNPNPNTKQALKDRSPFWLLHDIGKTAADQNMEVAQSLVFPVGNGMNRPSYDIARHWLHPQIGADLINIWANNTSKRIKIFAQKWAYLAHRHDYKLNPYLKSFKEKISNEDKLSLLIFSLCDTAVAIALPRPNNPALNNDVVRKVLQRKFMSDAFLKDLFPNKNLNQLRNYILASIFDSLDKLKNQYPESVWVKPTNINNPNFKFNEKTSQQKSHILDELVIQTWHDCEEFWQSTISNLIVDGIF